MGEEAYAIANLYMAAWALIQEGRDNVQDVLKIKEDDIEKDKKYVFSIFLDQAQARTAKHAGEANLLLDEVAALDLELLLSPNGCILTSKLAQLSYSRQKNFFRYWLRLNAFPLPSEVKLDDILRQLVEAGIDRHPKIRWGEVEVRRVKGEVILDVLTDQMSHGAQASLSGIFSLKLSRECICNRLIYFR
ncbi:MAG: TilS substrate-binding domain-containing protein [Gammaproteobacteria bacterium]